jgi:glycosyltransferase involved in cell wall biosynthesis
MINIKLSACLIVKNEQQYLSQCLGSLKAFADEIIVIDTGSTDRTIAIAKAHQAKVWSMSWDYDFSKARNYSIAQATGEWIIVIDADEILEPSAIATLQSVMQNPNCIAANLLRLEIGARQTPYSFVLRLFRNHPAIAFQGIYHESIDQTISKLQITEPQWQVVNIDIPAIKHYGYAADAITHKNKYEFALKMMHKHLKLYPDDVYILNKLGALYIGNLLENSQQKIQENLSQGIAILNQALSAIKSANHKYKQIYDQDVLTDQEHHQLMDQIKNQNLTLYEVYFHLGLAYSNSDLPELAKQNYLQATQLDVPEINKIGAYLNLGNIYQEFHQKEAITIFEKVTQIAPDYPQGYFNYGAALKTAGLYDQAIAAYQQAIALDPHYAFAYQNLGVVLMKTGHISESIQSFKMAIHLHEQQNNHEIAAMLRSELSL